MQKGDWGIGGGQRTPTDHGSRHQRAERLVEPLASIFFFVAMRTGGSSSSSSTESRSICQVGRTGSGTLPGMCTASSSSSLGFPLMTAGDAIAVSRHGGH